MWRSFRLKFFIIATLLTLLFLPALYVAWYKIREPQQEEHG